MGGFFKGPVLTEEKRVEFRRQFIDPILAAITPEQLAAEKKASKLIEEACTREFWDRVRWTADELHRKLPKL